MKKIPGHHENNGIKWNGELKGETEPQANSGGNDHDYWCNEGEK
ncbi:MULTISPECIES: hypothetical protein [Mesorhizobium]